MMSIPTAKKINFDEQAPNQGRFIIEPLYPGYGLTVGNALRRVLLSSLEGVAISSIRLKGADHEFSAIEGVKQDVVDIILNLKQVRFDVTGEFEEPIKLELKAKGAKEVRAKDFKKTAGVKIANPDLMIATLTDAKAEFELEVWVEKGRGYLPTEMTPSKEKEIGVIAIDAIFSPIKRVSIDTENVRVGEMTNWDRLLLDLETDGTIAPQDAIKKSASILVEQFSFLLENKTPTVDEEKLEIKKEEIEETKENEDNQSSEINHQETEIKNKNEENEEIEEKPKKRGRPKKEDKE